MLPEPFRHGHAKPDGRPHRHLHHRSEPGDLDTLLGLEPQYQYIDPIADLSRTAERVNQVLSSRE